MTTEAFRELSAAFIGFVCLYIPAIILVALGIIASIILAIQMDKLSTKIVILNSPYKKYSKGSIEGWKNRMYAVWKLGVGALIPCSIIYIILRYLPRSFVDEYIIVIDNNQFMISQALLLMQAIVFIAFLAMKYRIIIECYSAMRLAKESGL